MPIPSSGARHSTPSLPSARFRSDGVGPPPPSPPHFPAVADLSAGDVTATSVLLRWTTPDTVAAKAGVTYDLRSSADPDLPWDDSLDGLTRIDPRGETWQYTYDAMGNRTKSVDAEGRVTDFEYDLDGNLIRTVDHEGNEVRFEYNADKKAVIKNPDGGPYRDLVKAAEKCTAEVIHPGLPRDRSEKDIDKWIKRGEKFN